MVWLEYKCFEIGYFPPILSIPSLPFDPNRNHPFQAMFYMKSSTILALPNEIQLKIFYALHNSKETQISKQDHLRAVSQVCNRWRELTLCTSIFWTYIFITESSVDLRTPFDDPYTVDRTHVFRIVPWVYTLLYRSGLQPIDVCINLQSEHFDPALSEAQNQANFPWCAGHAIILSRLLVAQAARIRTVDILSEVWQPMQYLVEGLVGVPMPVLQTWSVTRDNPQWGHQLSSDLEMDSSMFAMECPFGIKPSADLSVEMYPKLHGLILQGVPQNWSQLIPRNLVELDLEYIPVDCRPTYEELKVILLGNQFSLQSLTLWAAAPPVGGYDTITLHNLKTLSLGFSFFDAAISLTTYLEVPSLINLEIYDMSHQNSSNFGDGHSVMTAMCLLEDFYLHMIDRWPLRQITQLTLRSPFFKVSDYDDLVDAFARQQEDDVPIPVLLKLLLHCLSLNVFHLIDPDIASLRSLVTVSPMDHQNFPVHILPCASLNLLHIEIMPGQSLPLDKLLQPNAYWGGGKIDLPLRAVDTVQLDVPFGCKSTLWSFLGVLNSTQEMLHTNDRRGDSGDYGALQASDTIDF
ncbi:hypothetical protein J3R30DRAFT_580189 [Lentinula aciculospora]|uniref:F-box domain-containing protein n=1 Tax=Lentinula aciculospora TaxID=153920 RepID=A0A9W9A7S8_9AGAR|nr:hypothetical protein J3R30DRAFT_580189 [Lentinula aciculospora]